MRILQLNPVGVKGVQGSKGEGLQGPLVGLGEGRGEMIRTGTKKTQRGFTKRGVGPSIDGRRRAETSEGVRKESGKKS